MDDNDPEHDERPQPRRRDVRRPRTEPKPQPADHAAYLRHTDQERVQRTWSYLRGRTAPVDVYIGDPEWHPVDFQSTSAITCGQCLQKMGRCIAFRTPFSFGVVEDTARWRAAMFGDETDPPLYAPTKHRPAWFVVNGEGLVAEVRFTCPHCKREYEPRNAHRLGKSLFDHPQPQMTLY